MPVVGLAEVLIQPSFKGTQRKIGQFMGPTADREGRAAGSRLGKGMADGLTSETGKLSLAAERAAKSVIQSAEAVASSRSRVADASLAEEKAIGALRVAELKLQEAKENSRAKASQLAAAEERVSTARNNAASATRKRQTAEAGLSKVSAELTRNQEESARASENLETHMRRVETASANAERGFNRLGETLSRALRGRPLGGVARSIREDSARIDFDLHRMAQNVSQQGTRGGRAFTQGFMLVAGGLTTVIPLAGAAGAALGAAAGGAIAMGSALKQMAGAAALAPAGLLAAGAAAGVLRTAFAGVGEALKESTELQAETAGNARLDAMAMEDAARQITSAEQSAAQSRAQAAKQLANAQRNAADVQADSARRIADAEQRAAEVREQSDRRIADARKALVSAIRQAAEQQAAAVRRVADAERDVERANRRVTESQMDLNDARAEAAQRVKDLNRSLEQAGLSEREATIRYEEAMAAFEKGVALGGQEGSKTMRRLQLDLDQAALALRTAQEDTVTLREEQQQASKDGVQGNKRVQSAEQSLADAREAALDAVVSRREAVQDLADAEAEGAERIAEAQESIAEATNEAAKAQVEAQRDITDATTDAARAQADAAESVADAYQNLEQTQVDGADAVADAYRNMERIQLQQAEAAATAGAAAATAMAYLTPAAQSATRALLAVYDQLGNIRRIAQENFFTGFTGPLMNLASTVMPQLAVGVGAIASMLGAGAQQLMNSLSTGLGGGVLEKMLLTVSDSIGILNKAIDPLVQAFITLGAVGMDYLPQMAESVASLAERFNEFIQTAALTGDLDRWIQDGIQAFKDLGSIIGSAAGTFGGIGDAVRAAGIDTSLGAMADAMNRVEAVVNGSVFQTTLSTILTGAAAGAAGLGEGLRAVGQAFVDGAPGLAEFLRLGGEIAGTFIGGIATALSNPEFGAGLTTFLEAVQRGVEALAPLMPGLTTAIGGLFTALAPIVEQLGPTLVTVFTGFATAVGTVLTALSPLLTALSGSPVILGTLIGAFAATAAASAALTLAGNVQKIAMFGWKIAALAVKGVLFLLRLEWVKAAAAAVVSGAQTAAVWLMYRLDSLKAAAAMVAAKARIVAGWVAMGAAATKSGIKSAAVWTGTMAKAAVRGVASFAVSVASVVAGWVVMGAQAVVQAARIAASWLVAMGPVGWIIGAVALVAAGLTWFFTQTEIGQKVFAAMWGKIKEAAAVVVDWFQTTVLPILTDIWNGIAAGAVWLWENALKPAWDGILAAVQAVMVWFQTVLAPAISTVFSGVGAVFTWLWENIIKPVFGFIGALIATWWATAKVVFNGAVWFFQNILAPVFTWLWDKIIKPVFGFIGTLFSTWWTAAKIIFEAVSNFLRNTLGPAFTWLRDNIITPVWDTIKSVISTAWDKGIKPIFEALAKFVKEDLPKAFETARDGITTAWDKIKEAAKKPVKFVVDTVLGGMIEAMWKIPGINKENLPKPKLPASFNEGFKKGGYTGDGPIDEVAGPAHRREFVFNAKATAAIGKEKLAAMAARATRGAAASVGEGNMGGFFEGNAANIRRYGAYFLDVPSSMKDWGFNAAARMWNGAAGVKVAIGKGNLQGRASVRERGGGILGYTMGNDIDMSPSWMRQLGQKQRITVAAHEMGHALGLPHNSLGSIMQPNLGQMASAPTAVDIRNLQKLYPGGSGKAGSAEAENPLDGIVDGLVSKFKSAFPGGGMFVDAAGGIARRGFDLLSKWVQDIKDGIKNIANDVADKVKNFFGGGSATIGDTQAPLFRDQGGILPPGISRVLNNTGGNEYVLNKRQWATAHGAMQRAADPAPGVVFTGPVYGDPVHLLDRAKTEQRRAVSRNNLRRVSV